MNKIRICKASDVPPAGMKCYDTDEGRKVLILNSGECYHAYQGLCPHQDVCLDEGFFDGSTLTCHQHLWQWDAKTGEAMGLAEAPLERYDVAHEDGELFLVQASALRSSPLFKGMGDQTLRSLEACARRETFDVPATLYDIGDLADDIYVLESGRVEFLIGREDRTSLAGFMLRRGEAFGWAALLEDHPRRIARAACLEPSVLLRINGAQALQLLEADPASGYRVMRQLSQLIARQLHSTGVK
jgi:toluene monooxygenase system ferredoxin subunit